MELEEESERAVWCLVAVVGGTDGQASAKGARVFDSGTKVYCFPPVRGGAYESVKVVGPARKTGKLASAVLAASDLCNWKAEAVANPEVLEQIAPPWDSSSVSKDVAKGIAAWKAGGPWPVAELREWNRTHAEKVVGEGTLLNKVRNSLSRLFQREED